MDLKSVIQEMIQWFEVKEDNILYTEFLEQKGISKRQFDKDIKKAGEETINLWEIAKTKEYNKLTKKAMSKDYSQRFVNHYMQQEHGWQQGGKDGEMDDNDATDIAEKIGLAKTLKNNKVDDLDMITEEDIKNLDV